jgi:peptidyl-prolyl cis-trans isomerase SurA
MKRFGAIILLLFSAVAGMRAAGEEYINGIAAIANDSILTYREVRDYTLSALEMLYRTQGNNPRFLEQREREIQLEGLDQLIEKQLILDEFKSSGGALPDSFIDDEIKDRIRQKFGDRAHLIKNLQAEGITFETFRKRIHDEIIVAYMQQKNVSSVILISPAKIERYYATNLANYKMGEEIKLRMIVLGRSSVESVDEVKRLASEVQAKIGQGAPFAEMAAVYSTGSQRTEGGDWGWIELNKLNKGLSDVAFALSTGQRSDVIGLARQDGFYWTYHYDPAGAITSARKYTEKDAFLEEKKFTSGSPDPGLPAPQEFYLMLVEDRRPARVRPLSEVRADIEKDLQAQERARLRRKWIDRLMAKAYVRRF